MSLGLLRPCLTCGEPSTESRCESHRTYTRAHAPARGTAEERGYDAAWRRLSRRARRLQPFCSGCGSTRNLSGEHTPQAWWRKLQGKPIRLQDIDVLCAKCQAELGSSRPGSERYAEWIAAAPTV